MRIERILGIGATLCAAACSSLVAATTLDEWVAQNVGQDEKLLCKHEASGEYFFIAQAGSRLKLGSRLDMTEYTGTHAFIVSWRLRDEKNESSVTRERPIPLRDKDVQSEEKRFADSVEYRALRAPRSETISATIEVKKCQTSECDRQAGSKEERRYTVKICEAALDK
jgi:hypothetical protein